MARLRSAPGSAVKPGLVTSNSLPSFKSPLKTGRPNDPHERAVVSTQADVYRESESVGSRSGSTGLDQGSKPQASSSNFRQGTTSAGRKRTSEEFMQDVDADVLDRRTNTKSIRPCSRDKSPAEFTSIDDIFGEPPPPYSSVAGVKCSQPNSLERTYPPESGDLRVQDETGSFVEEYSVTETRIRTETKKRKSLSRTRSGLTPMRKTTKFHREVPHDEISPTKSRNRIRYMPTPADPGNTPIPRKRVVADSEDEETELGPSQVASPVASPVVSRPSPQHPSPLRLRPNKLGVGQAERRSAMAQSPLTGTPNRKVDKHGVNADHGEHFGSPSPPHRNSPTKAAAVSPVNAVTLRESSVSETLVKKLLEIDEVRLERLLQEASRELEDRLERAYDVEVETGEQPPALVEDIRLWGVRKKSLEELSETRRQYQFLNTRKVAIKDSVKLRILHRGLKGESDGSEDPIMAENRKIIQEMRRIESEVARRISPAVASYLASQLLSRDCNDGISVEVTATQLPPKPRLNERTSASTVFAQELVHQTQLTTPPRRARTMGPDARTESVAQQGATIHASVEPRLSDDRNGVFTTFMGTPPARIDDEDEFGGYDDDAEMLEAADDIENKGAKEGTFWSGKQRAVFRETSGNGRDPAMTPAHSSWSKAPTRTAAQPTLDPSLMQHPWSRDVKTVLRDRFHLKGFRKNQLEAINATLSGKNVFVLMPTGGGKSLCYQLPSIIRSGKTRGVTVVISPLLSLMEDQVQHLKKLNIQAFYLNSLSTPEQRHFILDGLRETRVDDFIQLLYVTPEMLSKSQAIIQVFGDLHCRQRLARIVIDEAHCVSQWGHDFRPDYKALGKVCEQFVGVPIMALTATATENVKVDVIHNLGINGCEVFSQTFNRPNLTYKVLFKDKKISLLDEIAKTINETYRGQSGIIYCLSRKKCEEIAKKLRDAYRIRAQHYHAGMDATEKVSVQRDWQAGRYNVIVATIAFGMGIDKGDVRFVIHHSIPKSLEGYYQETGRAGRDGKRSGCYLYYGYQDTNALRRMIDKSEGSREQKERQYQMMRNVVQFCENRSDCRRVQVLAYFGERFRREDCNGACDNCNSTSKFENRDFSNHAAAAVRLVRQLQNDKVTILQCVDAFRGAKAKRSSWSQLGEYGFGADLERGDVERLFQRLLIEDALEEINVVNNAGFATQYIGLGRRCEDYARGRRRLEIQVRLTPNGKLKSPTKGPKKVRTSVGVARQDYPLSTNVSSPIQEAAKRRATKKRIKRTERPDIELHHNGYARDSFVVEDEEGSSDAFEPFKEIRQRCKGKTLRLGPPITADERLDQLEPCHKMVVEDFLVHAKKECANLMMKKGLREQPFSDTVLREMAIQFPDNHEDLLRIPGVDPSKASLYGNSFLKLVRRCRDRYHNELGNGDQNEDKPHDPNHVVVSLLSEEDEGGDFDLDNGNSPPGHQSSYFQLPARVAAFNAGFLETQKKMQTPQPRPPQSPSPPAAAAADAAWAATSTTSHRRTGEGSRTSAGQRPNSRRNVSSKSRRTSESADYEGEEPSARRRRRPANKRGGGRRPRYDAIDAPHAQSLTSRGIGMMPT